MEILYQIAGRLSLLFDVPRRFLPARHGFEKDPITGVDLDGTGRVVADARAMEVLWNDGEVIYVNHNSFGHSFWRAQEFSLFQKHKNLIRKPIADLGCGDGSFGSVLFDEIDLGIDIDSAALAIASEYGTYKVLVKSAGTFLPLESASVRTVISNSVLEHVSDLRSVLNEVHRILVKKGNFVFTVPTRQFERDLTKYYGARESRRINAESFHRNLLESAEWQELLSQNGFIVRRIVQFQPDWFSFWYRMFRLLGNRGLGMFVPGIRERAWRKFHPKLVEMVRRSILDTQVGGNLFIVAERR